MDDVVTALTAGVGDLTAQIPAVLGIAIPVAMIFWGGPKLIGLVRKVGK